MNGVTTRDPWVWVKCWSPRELSLKARLSEEQTCLPRGSLRLLPPPSHGHRQPLEEDDQKIRGQRNSHLTRGRWQVWGQQYRCPRLQGELTGTGWTRGYFLSEGPLASRVPFYASLLRGDRDSVSSRHRTQSPSTQRPLCSKLPSHTSQASFGLLVIPEETAKSALRVQNKC